MEWVNKEKYHSKYNVCPTNNVLVMYCDPEQKRPVLRSMQWGYIPSWSRNTNMNKPINARLETLEDKSMFDGSKSTKRCVVIAEGFFEWKKLSNNKRQPYYVTRKDGQLMVFAGLYDVNSFIGDTTFSCTIITTNASNFFKSIHNRMPVILNPENILQWIDNRVGWSQPIIDLLKPFEGQLNCDQVSEAVGSTKNNSPDLIVPVDTKKSSISYFLKEEKDKDPMDKFEKFALEQAASQEDKKRKSSSSPAAASPPAKKKAAPAAKSMKITNFFGKK